MAKVTWVIGPSGEVQKIPWDERDNAIRAGYVAATPQQIEESKVSQKVGGTPGWSAVEGLVSGGVSTLTAIPRAIAGGLSAAGVAAPDLSSLAGPEVIKAMERHALRQSFAEHGTPLDQATEAKYLAEMERESLARAGTTAGQVGNFAGQLAGSGPLMELGAGLKAATGLGGTGAGVLSRAAGGAVEGAGMLAPQAVADASEQADREGRALTGEQALAAVAHGVIGGGLVGGGLGALGGLIGKVAGRRAARTIEATGETIEPEAIAEPKKPSALARVMGAVSGKNPETISELTSLSPAGKEARRLAVFEGDSTREAAERAMRGHGNQLEDSLRNITPNWRTGKAENVAKVIAREPEAIAQQSAIAQDALAGIREKVDQMADKDVFGSRGDVNRIAASLRNTEKRVAAGIEAGKPEEVFTALDTLKKDVGVVGEKLERARVANEIETFSTAQQMQDTLRDTLMHESWGGAGQMQRDVNAAFQEWIPARKLFKQRFLTETGQEGWAKTYGMDPGKIQGWVRGINDPAKDLDHALVDQYLGATKRLTESLSRAGGLTTEKAAELEAVSKAVEGFQTEMGTAGKAIAAVNKLDQLRGGAQHGIGVGSLIGNAIAGHLGGGLGAILGAATNPAALVERMAVAERLAGRTASSATQALDRLFSGIGGAEKVTAPLGQAFKVSTLDLFTGHHETPELAYKQRVDELIEAPTQLPDRLAHALGGQGIQDPAMSVAAFTAANRAIEYLKQHLPVGKYDMTSMTPQTTQQTPSRPEIAEFADRWAAVTHPRDVLAGLPDGKVSPVQMEAIGHVYPSMYNWLRDQAMQRVQDADTAGHEIPLRQRTILDQAFDLDAAAGPTFSTAFAAKWGPQMGDQAQRKQLKPNPGAKPVLGQRLQTLSQIMMGT